MSSCWNIISKNSNNTNNNNNNNDDDDDDNNNNNNNKLQVVMSDARMAMEDIGLSWSE